MFYWFSQYNRDWNAWVTFFFATDNIVTENKYNFNKNIFYGLQIFPNEIQSGACIFSSFFSYYGFGHVLLV